MQINLPHHRQFLTPACITGNGFVWSPKMNPTSRQTMAVTLKVLMILFMQIKRNRKHCIYSIRRAEKQRRNEFKWWWTWITGSFWDRQNESFHWRLRPNYFSNPWSISGQEVCSKENWYFKWSWHSVQRAAMGEKRFFRSIMQSTATDEDPAEKLKKKQICTKSTPSKLSKVKLYQQRYLFDGFDSAYLVHIEKKIMKTNSLIGIADKKVCIICL